MKAECDICRKKYRFPDDQDGEYARCKLCEAEFEIRPYTAVTSDKNPSTAKDLLRDIVAPIGGAFLLLVMSIGLVRGLVSQAQSNIGAQQDQRNQLAANDDRPKFIASSGNDVKLDGSEMPNGNTVRNENRQHSSVSSEKNPVSVLSDPSKLPLIIEKSFLIRSDSKLEVQIDGKRCNKAVEGILITPNEIVSAPLQSSDENSCRFQTERILTGPFVVGLKTQAEDLVIALWEQSPRTTHTLRDSAYVGHLTVPSLVFAEFGTVDVFDMHGIVIATKNATVRWAADSEGDVAYVGVNPTHGELDRTKNSLLVPRVFACRSKGFLVQGDE